MGAVGRGMVGRVGLWGRGTIDREAHHRGGEVDCISVAVDVEGAENLADLCIGLAGEDLLSFELTGEAKDSTETRHGDAVIWFGANDVLLELEVLSVVLEVCGAGFFVNEEDGAAL